MHLSMRQTALFALLLLGLTGVAARAATPPSAPAGTSGTGWHVVRPGDTLEQIAARFLGSADLWRQLAQLNPDIADPDRLTPGQRVKVPPPRGTAEAAQVARLARQVETQPSPIAWGEARLGDLLLARDGLRTFRQSSAEMAFLDGTRLLVTEDSLVFLQHMGGGLRGVNRKGVEIVAGQADVEAQPNEEAAAAPRAGSAGGGEIEIVVGSARATSRSDRASAARTRARRADGGSAKLMVYGGASEVEAGGARVQVPQGMGTSVEESGPPSPPERLLAAPRALSPAAGAEVPCADPPLAWEPVPDAVAYTVEICRDPACGSLVARATGVAAPPWRPASLAVGELYWRVTARSRSGLDGYPGEPRLVKVTAAHDDDTPPAGTLALVGPQVRVGETLFAGPASHLEVTASDESGIERWLPVVGGREGGAADAAGPWAAGSYAMGAVAVDRCGNRGTLAPLAFTVDATPPAITWEVVPYDVFEASTRRGERRWLFGRHDEERRPAGLSWSGGVQWLPLPAGTAVRIDSDLPQVFLHGAARVVADGREAALDAGRMLRVRAADGESHVDHLSFRTRNDGGRTILEIEAADLVGNVRRVEWELRY